jgi:single-stranded DNA-binding protein
VDGTTLFVPCVAWEQLGENVAESLRKGATVAVSGRVEPKEYDSNGVKVRGFELIADDVSVSLRRQQATVKKTTTTPSYNNQSNGYNSYSPNTQYTTDPYATGEYY